MTDTRKPIVRQAGEGWLTPNGQLIVLEGADTGGRFTLQMPGRGRAPSESGPPAHQHAFEETFVVMKGEMTFFVDGEEITVEEGGLVHVPSMVSHTFANRGEAAARTMVIASPPGIEVFMRELAKLIDESDEPIEVLQRRVMERLGTRVTGGPPETERDGGR